MVIFRCFIEELVRSMYGLDILLLAAVWSGVSDIYSIQRCSLVWLKCWVLWDLRLAVVYRQKGLAMLLEEGRKWVCLCWAIHSSGGVASAIRARSAPATCAARDSHTNELRLFLSRLGAHWLCFTHTCTVLWSQGALEGSWAMGTCWKADCCPEGQQPQQGSSRHAGSVTGLLFNTQLTYISLLGQARLGSEPWASVCYSCIADPAVLLLRLPNTATAAILYWQWITPWQSINLSSCFTFWALRDGVLATYRLFLKNFMGQIESFMGQKAAIGNSMYFASVCI